MGEEQLVPPEATPTPAPSDEEAAFQLFVPWRVVEGEDFLTVHDLELNEICRIPTSVPWAMEIAQTLCATPWLMIAAQRTLMDLNRAIDRKDGTTLRQWAKNHDGCKRREELEHALKVALNPDAAEQPPQSFGIIRKPRPKPTSTVVPKKAEKSLREMLG